MKNTICKKCLYYEEDNMATELVACKNNRVDMQHADMCLIGKSNECEGFVDAEKYYNILYEKIDSNGIS